MAAPGVVVATATRSGPTGEVRAQSGQYFAIGITERGPVNAPEKINSLGDYIRIFGDRVTYGALYDDLQMFFEVGGKQAHVLRVVGAAATSGTLSINDGAGVPAPTVKFDAANPGAWSTRVTIQVAAGTDANTRKVVVRLDGEIVEQYNNLATVADIVTRFSKSPYVRASDLGSAAVGALALPIVTAATPLSAGTDDRAAVNAARLEAKLPLFAIGLGDGAVAAPGYGTAMHAALIAHARLNRRVALVTGPRGATRDDLAVLGLGLAATVGAESAGLFGGWIQVSDGAGGVRTISNEGYVAAARARAHEAVGPWSAAAGEGSLTPYIVGTDLEVSRADHDILDAARVNPIRLVGGRLRLYGWRSLSSDEDNFASLTVMDTLNRLVTECELRLEPFVFKTIDGGGKLLSQMAGILIGVLEPIRTAGGIFENIVDGELIDPGYSVDVSPNINTVESLAQNEINAQIVVRLSPNAATIILNIVKAGLSAAV